MDSKFHPAIVAIKTGDLERLRSLVHHDGALATSRSTTSHPTLLQCLVLDGNELANKVEMAKVLVDAGADIEEPFVACASIDNIEVGEFLLNAGASVDGVSSWSPLEEALYWNSRRMIEMLLHRGAAIKNLRVAAGLGRIDRVEQFFNPDGSLKPEAGRINWPWGDRKTIEQSNCNPEQKQKLLLIVSAWPDDRGDIVDNAFVYACMHGHIDAAELLLEKGAQLNAIPGGFDFAGTGLHYAALNGHRAMVDFLIGRGADASIRDMKVNSTASGWAEHGGHVEIRDRLKRLER